MYSITVHRVRVVVMGLLSACLASSFVVAQESVEGEAPPQPLEVSIATAETQSLSTPAVYGTRLLPGAEYSISSPANGTVTRLSVRVGQTLRPGAPIARIQRGTPAQQFLPAEVEAPYAGTVVSVPVRIGQHVGEGQEIALLSDHAAPRLEVLVSDRDIGALTIGDEIEIAYPTSGASTTGRIRSIYLTGDVARGLYTVEVIPGRINAPIGAYIEATFAVRPFRGVAVPNDAVIRRDDQSFVWVVVDGTAERRDVTVAGRYRELLAITDGLVPGDRYIPLPTGELRDGIAVTTNDE